ncbi:hypothetical protein DVH05_016928 [Phytophthora capsici]|nr:hypothetical protein DVH05_016928 [Phytophthora capsici]
MGAAPSLLQIEQQPQEHVAVGDAHKLHVGDGFDAGQAHIDAGVKQMHSIGAGRLRGGHRWCTGQRGCYFLGGMSDGVLRQYSTLRYVDQDPYGFEPELRSLVSTGVTGGTRYMTICRPNRARPWRRVHITGFQLAKAAGTTTDDKLEFVQERFAPDRTGPAPHERSRRRQLLREIMAAKDIQPWIHMGKEEILSAGLPRDKIPSFCYRVRKPRPFPLQSHLATVHFINASDTGMELRETNKTPATLVLWMVKTEMSSTCNGLHRLSGPPNIPHSIEDLPGDVTAFGLSILYTQIFFPCADSST